MDPQHCSYGRKRLKVGSKEVLKEDLKIYIID
jgi:hypothetical protein